MLVGVLAVCFLSELMTTRFGRGFYEGGSMDLKFTRPLWLGVIVEAWGVRWSIMSDLWHSRRAKSSSACMHVSCSQHRCNSLGGNFKIRIDSAMPSVGGGEGGDSLCAGDCSGSTGAL